MNASRSLTRKLVSMPMIFILLAFLGLSVMSVATAPKAEAATYNTFSRAYGVWMPAGTGRPYGGWVGTFKGRAPTGEFLQGPCVDRNLGMANAKDIIKSTSTLPGATADESRRMRFLANKYGMAASNTTAKRLGMSVWIIQDPTMKTYMAQMKSRGYVTSADVTAINAMISESERHGPYNTSLSGPAVGVTKSTTLTLKVRSAHGYYPPAGGTVSFTVSSNAVITAVNGVAGKKSGSVSTTGFAKVTVKVTGEGLVEVTPYVDYPSSGAVLINVRSTTSVQRIIGGAIKERSTASFSFEKKVGGPAYTTVCSTNCDGKAVVTASVSNDAANSPVKYAFMKQDGTVIGYKDVAPGAVDQKLAMNVTDATVITSRYCHTATVGGPCVTGWTNNPGSYEVVCPAWIQVAITVGCNCLDAWGNVALNNPVTSRHNVATIEVAQPGLPTAVSNHPMASGQKLIVPLKSTVAPGTVITVKWTSYKSSTNLTVIPGYDHKTMEAIQLIFGGGTSSNQLDSASDVKVLTDTKMGSVKIGDLALAS